jgi:hypothetical protein
LYIPEGVEYILILLSYEHYITKNNVGTPDYTQQYLERQTLICNIYHQPINVPTAGEQAFLMDCIKKERTITHHLGPVPSAG